MSLVTVQEIPVNPCSFRLNCVAADPDFRPVTHKIISVSAFLRPMAVRTSARCGAREDTLRFFLVSLVESAEKDWGEIHEKLDEISKLLRGQERQGSRSLKECCFGKALAACCSRSVAAAWHQEVQM